MSASCLTHTSARSNSRLWHRPRSCWGNGHTATGFRWFTTPPATNRVSSVQKTSPLHLIVICPQDTSPGLTILGDDMSKKPTLRGLFELAIVASAVQVAPLAHADVEDRSRSLPMQIPSGQYVTPTYIRNSVQQFLNPRLAAYPDFVAGEAVKSQLSPDGKTLAVICAGQNSLNKPDGTVDTAASTQFIFLYNVAGKNKAKPVLSQVLQQTNSHVGLVFAPDGRTLWATPARESASVSRRTPAAWVSRPMARPSSLPTTTTTRSPSSTLPHVQCDTNTICARSTRTTKALTRASAVLSRFASSSTSTILSMCPPIVTVRSWRLTSPRPAQAI